MSGAFQQYQYGSLAPASDKGGAASSPCSSNDSWELPEEKEADGNKSFFSRRPIVAWLGGLALLAVSLVALVEMSPQTKGLISSFVTTSIMHPGPAGEDSTTTDVSMDVSTDEIGGTDAADVDASILTFSLKRDGYDPLIYFSPLDLSVVQYEILVNYVAVIEPYAGMALEVYGTADDKYYTFEACSLTDSTECYSGTLYTDGYKTSQTIKIACEPLEDEYFITVNELSSASDTVLRTSSGYALCMYVRREIRTLTEADRDATMDAMYTMWSTNEADGQKEYGADYHSSTFLLEFHFFNAAWQDGDHIHEGNGFLPQHIKMTNIFENSIQSVDPTVTMPYWDFTIESTQNISVMLSPVFTEEMFGSMPRSIDQFWGWTFRNDSMSAAAIQDGRWAFIKADKNDRYDDLNFAYGYLRAPWNMNPSPYLSRFTSTNKHLPSCTSHYQLMEYDDLSDFLFESPYAAHAATHGTIGGVYGCDMMDPMMDMGYLLDDDGQINLCKNWIFYLKEFYRLDYLVPYSNCTLSEDGSLASEDLMCGYTCNPDYTEDFVFELKNILNSDYDCVPYDLQDKGWMAWKDFICTGDGYKIFGGDHLEAASPADPSFWPIHPTLERLLQAKYMAGGFEDDTWPSDATTDYVCDKAECYDEDNGFGYWDTCCYGHYEDDQLMDAATGDRDNGYGLTNAEVHAYTDPTTLNYNMPYIYGDFDWSHCELVGLDFATLMEDMAVRRRRLGGVEEEGQLENGMGMDEEEAERRRLSLARWGTGTKEEKEEAFAFAKASGYKSRRTAFTASSLSSSSSLSSASTSSSSSSSSVTRRTASSSSPSSPKNSANLRAAAASAPIYSAADEAAKRRRAKATVDAENSINPQHWATRMARQRR